MTKQEQNSSSTSIKALRNNAKKIQAYKDKKYESEWYNLRPMLGHAN